MFYFFWYVLNLMSYSRKYTIIYDQILLETIEELALNWIFTSMAYYFILSFENRKREFIWSNILCYVFLFYGS